MTGAAQPALASLLEARRSRYNAQFAEARRNRPSLDPAHFSHHLREVVGPLVERVAEVAPGRAADVADELYDMSLDLVGRDLLGPLARYPDIVEGWTWLLAEMPNRLAESPRQLAGAVTNALYQLVTTPGARPQQWLHAVSTLSSVAGSTAELLEAAKVAAWRAGLAHYRVSALEHLRTLEPGLACMALGLPDTGLARDELDTVIHQLLADPWLEPRAALRGKPEQQFLRQVGRVGAFRGFGGTFMRPPQVTCPGGVFVASDGETHWMLHADRFGATLHRLASIPTEAPVMSAPLFKVGLGGKVSRGRFQAVFADLHVSHSSAANTHTLAVTTPLSHAVYLIAVVGE
jgi:hypothetical protein